jgi:hypothetical protein
MTVKIVSNHETETTKFKVKVVHISELQCYIILDEDAVVIGWIAEDDVVVVEWVNKDDVVVGLVDEDDITEMLPLEEEHCEAATKLGFEYVVVLD